MSKLVFFLNIKKNIKKLYVLLLLFFINYVVASIHGICSSIYHQVGIKSHAMSKWKKKCLLKCYYYYYISISLIWIATNLLVPRIWNYDVIKS